jgi:hypothetical protein
METVNEKWLQHWGVLGMHWGKKKSTGPASGDHLIASKIKSKRMEEMSNEELRYLSNRLQLEKTYRELNPQKKPWYEKVGRNAVETSRDVVVRDVATKVGLHVGATAASYAINYMIKKGVKPQPMP